MLKQTCLLLAATPLLTGCPSSKTVNSDDVEDDSLVREYTVEVDQEASLINFKVQFRVGTFSSDSVQLVHPSYVEVNGEEMRLRHSDDRIDSWNGTDYFLQDQLAPHPEGHTFVWHKSDETTATQHVPAPLGVDLTDQSITLKLGEDNELSLKVPELHVDDEIIAVIDMGGRTAYGSHAGDRILFDQTAMTELRAGEATLTLKRTTTTHVDSTSKATRIVRHHRNSPITVTIQ